MEKTSQIREIVETAVINLKQAAEVNTIIGKPIMTEQGTIMPVSQMTFAFVAGGGEYGNVLTPLERINTGRKGRVSARAYQSDSLFSLSPSSDIGIMRWRTSWWKGPPTKRAIPSAAL